MAKKKKAEKKARPTRIGVPDKGLPALRNILGAMQAAQNQLATYVAALRVGLDVPDDWNFDVQQMAFVPKKDGG